MTLTSCGSKSVHPLLRTHTTHRGTPIGLAGLQRPERLLTNLLSLSRSLPPYLSFGGLRGGSALYLLFSLQCRVARSNERPSAARSGAKCLLELTLTYLERLVATRCAWVPLCCASVRAHFHTLTTGSALNSAQAAKANAATSANPDGTTSPYRGSPRCAPAP